MREDIIYGKFTPYFCHVEKNEGEKGLVLIMNDEFGRLIFEGDTGKIGGVEWDENKYLTIELITHQEQMATYYIEFWSEENTSDNPDVRVKYGIIPNLKVSLTFTLRELRSERFFLPTFPGSFKGQVHGKPLNVKKVNRFAIFKKNYEKCKIEVFDIYLSDTMPQSTFTDVKLVDEFGQLNTREWPGKTKSFDELNRYLMDEYQQSLVNIEPLEGRNEYGGWTGKKFDATGFFRMEHDGNRWWMVDPIGCAFYSSGFCYGSRMGDFGWVHGIESLYQWLPDKKDRNYEKAWITAEHITEYAKRNGEVAGRDKYLINFARANMIRVFGDQWWEAWMKITRRRLIQWGINTIGVGVNNYEDEDVEKFLKKVKIPYVLTLKRFPTTKANIFRDLPDVFSCEYKKNSLIFAEQIKKFTEDPFLIGYFITNEPEWVFEDDINLAEQLLANENELETKNEFIRFISERYNGDIIEFNKVWNLKLGSFELLKNKLPNAAGLSIIAEKDLQDFNEMIIVEFGKVPSEAIKRLDPHHLNLGMRYSRPYKKVFIGYENFDVFSFNRYTDNPYDDLETVGKVTNKPIVIGEFHFGAADRGLFNSALKAVPNQEERGKAYRYYMENAAWSKYCVGAHYFEYNDQPLLGRFDGEGMQHGVIDVCNKPYMEMVEQIVETNKHIYEVAEGLRDKFDGIPNIIEEIW